MPVISETRGAGVVEHREHHPVATATPGPQVRSGEYGLNLIAREKPEQGFLETFHRYRQDLLSQMQGWRRLQGHVAGKGAHCGQSRIAAAHRVVAFGFQVREEVQYQRRIGVIERQLGRWFAGFAFGIAQQQPEGVAIGHHGSRTGVAVLEQPLGKEALEQFGEFGGVKIAE